MRCNDECTVLSKMRACVDEYTVLLKKCACVMTTVLSHGNSRPTVDDQESTIMWTADTLLCYADACPHVSVHV